MHIATMKLPDFHSVSRAMGSIFGASVITFGLFVLMQQLIANSRLGQQQEAPLTFDPVVYSEPNEKVIERPKPLPPVPPKVQPKPMTPEPAATSNESLVPNGFNPTMGLEEITIDDGFANRQGDQFARPIVRVEPQYPASAARDGVEGWVQLRFTINAAGGVTDIEVIDAEPKRVFNRAARRALGRWKYQPKVVDGRAVAQPNMHVMLEFNLSQ